MTTPIKPLSAPKMAVRTAIILLVFVLVSMTFMKKAERKTTDEGGGRLW